MVHIFRDHNNDCLYKVVEKSSEASDRDGFSSCLFNPTDMSALVRNGMEVAYD